MQTAPRARIASLVVLCGMTLLTCGTTVSAQTKPAATPMPMPAKAPKPKISAKQAEAAAIKKIPGKVNASKYEYEDGRWQYAVTLTDKKGQMYEVEVNATTGKVMDSEKTSMAEEAKEEAADKKKAMSPAAAPKMGKGEEKDDEKDEKDEKSGKG